VGLKVAHTGRPHRLTLKIKEGEPAALGVALIEPARDPSDSARLLLDACASGPPPLTDGPPVSFTWLVWPNSSEVVLVLVNRGNDSTVRLGTVALTELDAVPSRAVRIEPRKTAPRVLGLYLAGPHALDPYGAAPGSRVSLETALNLADYLDYCGASAVVLPEHLADRSLRRALDGQADEDPTGPDGLETIRRVLERRGHSLWIELEFGGTRSLPGLPPADSALAAARGLVRLDQVGHVTGPAYHPLHPEVRAAMKRRIVTVLAGEAQGSAQHARPTHAPSGLLIRLGPGPTLLGTPDTGLDDATFERFVLDTFSPETVSEIPGMDKTDPDRFAVRSRYLAGVGRMPWLTWRARAVASLYGELAATAQEIAPGTVLAVATPALDDGPAGAEARRIDRAGLAPSQAWRSVGLDLQTWPNHAAAPLVLRGVSLSTDWLAHDLSLSPDLDALVAERTHKGMLLSIDGDDPTPVHAERSNSGSPGWPARSMPFSEATASARTAAEQPSRGVRPARSQIWLSALPMGNGLIVDEPLGHALAALDARFMFVAGKAVAGHEEGIGRFAAVLRALPAWPAAPLGTESDPDTKRFGITVRRMGDDAQTFLELANDSPYPIRLAAVLKAPSSAPVEDLARGLRLFPHLDSGMPNLVLDLVPFGVSAIRVPAPNVTISSTRPYPAETVLTAMQSRFNELTAHLAQLNRGLATIPSEPPNPGFEPQSPPDSSSPVHPIAHTGTTQLGPPRGNEIAVAQPWRLEGGTRAGTSAVIDRDKPHSGTGSLKLSCSGPSASVISGSFLPNAQSSLTMQLFLRAAATGTKVRVWIEGESPGQPYVRRTELIVSTNWEEFAVRASDISVMGLTSARLRIELVGPGTLWLDDLRIAGDSDARSTRLSAQRTLLAALQAYREQRYTDFARLAASHWIKDSNPATIGRLARRNDLYRSAEAGSNDAGAGTASALPPDHKLR
jgi:hypothetical protein